MATQFLIKNGKVLVRWPSHRKRKWGNRKLSRHKAGMILWTALQNKQTQGDYSYNRTGKLWGVSPMCVYQIVNKQTWKGLLPVEPHIEVKGET